MPKKTVKAIVESGNDYLIAVKGNQPKLQAQIHSNIATSQPLSTFTQKEKNRGRIEQRYVALYDNIDQIDSEWVGVQRLVFVHRTGYRPDKGPCDEKHYYMLSSCINDAQIVAQAIRGHWLIENQLHYVKDVHFNEDRNKIRKGNPASILSLFQDMAINLYRCLGYNSLKKATIHHANKVNELYELINAHHISVFQN